MLGYDNAARCFPDMAALVSDASVKLANKFEQIAMPPYEDDIARGRDGNIVCGVTTKSTVVCQDVHDILLREKQTASGRRERTKGSRGTGQWDVDLWTTPKRLHGGAAMAMGSHHTTWAGKRLSKRAAPEDWVSRELFVNAIEARHSSVQVAGESFSDYRERMARTKAPSNMSLWEIVKKYSKQNAPKLSLLELDSLAPTADPQASTHVNVDHTSMHASGLRPKTWTLRFAQNLPQSEGVANVPYNPAALLSPPTGSGFSMVAIGYEHGCALKKNGTAVCWGNTYGGYVCCIHVW